MKNKLLIYINNIGNGTTERLAVSIANGFVKKDTEVILITDRVMKTEYSLDENVVRSEALLSDTEKDYKDNKIHKLIRKRLKDIIKNNPGNTILVFGVPAAYRILQVVDKNQKVILVDRADPESEYKNIKEKKQIAGLYQRMSKIILQTKENILFWEESEIQKKCFVLPQIMDSKYLGKQRNKEPEKNIVYVGQIKSGSGHMALVQAFERLLENYADYELYFYGETLSRNSYLQVRELIEAHNLKDKIHFLDRTTNMQEEIYKARLFVLPSMQSGVSVMLMQAMALGLPVLASDNPDRGAREVIEDGINGLLFQVGDADELYIAMKKYLDYPEEAERIAIEAQKIAMDFAPEEVINQWYEVTMQ